ncbi:MAG: hypothetical protein CM15mP68_0600 [Pseudomonadota bacterium]|nr:MAG: hypothetical protein CM15mP68_0600 [Pseudomonadota bacterium]
MCRFALFGRGLTSSLRFSSLANICVTSPMLERSFAKCRDSDFPTLTFGAQTIFDRNLYVSEEDLGKVLVARHVLDGSYFDSRRVHGDQQAGNTVVFRIHIELSAREQNNPLRPRCAGGPNFLPINDIIVAI